MSQWQQPLTMKVKSLSSMADICGACEDHLAVKHCNVCPVNLCVSCAKGHQKLKIISHHPLADIVATSKPKQSAVRNGTCPKHTQQQFTILCKDCLQLGCDSCKIDHLGHSLQHLKDNPKLCQRVCSKHIQLLLDDLNEIEEIKSVLEGQVITYDNAITIVDEWEVDLLKLIKEKASKLRKQLKDLKSEKNKQIDDQVHGLMTKLKDIDRSIAKLNETRKSVEISFLSNELSKSYVLMEKLQSYKDEMKPLPVPLSVDDVLPNKDRLKDAKGDVAALFTAGQIFRPQKGPRPVAEWQFTKAKNGKDLSDNGKNNVTMTNIQYGPRPDGENDGAAIFPTAKDQNMIVMNLTDKLKFNNEMTAFVQVCLSGQDDGMILVYDDGMECSTDGGTYCFVYDTSMQICSGSHFPVARVIPANAWHKIALVFQATSVAVYIDGKLAHTANQSLDLVHTHRSYLHFGKRPGHDKELSGRIACCKLFDRALELKDIQQL